MTTATGEEIQITAKKIKNIGSDPVKTAKAINLVYVNDNDPGITREKKGETFQYFFNGQQIKDDEELLRIKHLFGFALKKTDTCKPPELMRKGENNISTMLTGTNSGIKLNFTGFINLEKYCPPFA